MVIKQSQKTAQIKQIIILKSSFCENLIVR